MTPTSPPTLLLRVVQRREIADGVCALTLAKKDGTDLPSWTPGAHIDLEVAGGLVRQYSLCGDPGVHDQWEVAVLREEQSRGGSAFIHDKLRTGLTVRARGPRNLFPLVDEEEYLFIAGGIGVTPLLPMIAEVERRGAPWRLVYGGRNRASMAFCDGLVAGFADRVTLLPEDEHGLLPVDELVAGVDERAALYCCGPEPLISAVEKAHAEHGRGSLHVERFAAKELEEPLATGAFEVEAARSGKVVTVEPEETILAALARVGVQVLSSCTEGICGTCEVFVLEGRPEHRDSILTPDEQKAGATMFPCISRCLSPRLVLDV